MPATVLVDASKVKRGVTHYFAVWLWIGWMNFYFNFTLLLPVLYMYCKPLLSVIVGLMILSAFTSVDRKKQPKWAMNLGLWVMKKNLEYFHVKMVAEDQKALEKSGTAIFALEPHDVLPLSIFAFNDHIKGFSGHNCLGCLTSAAFQIPMMRHMYTWVNATSIDKTNLVKMLNNGISPIICPGGVQEVTMMEREDECVLFLKSRFGFVKLALKHGVAIVPVFSFGLRNSYNYIVPKGDFMLNLARKIGFLPMAFFGVWGAPLGPAKPCDYTNVIGKPIAIPKIAEENITEELILKYHTQFLEAMTALYERHKAEHGMGDVSLRII